MAKVFEKVVVAQGLYEQKQSVVAPKEHLKEFVSLADDSGIISFIPGVAHLIFTNHVKHWVGISVMVLNWFCPHLSQIFCVAIGHFAQGELQGSVLGPLQFSIYMEVKS